MISSDATILYRCWIWNVLRDSKMIFFRTASYVAAAANDNDNAANTATPYVSTAAYIRWNFLQPILAIPEAIWQMLLPPVIEFPLCNET